jgi:hypothetical protein
VFGNSIVVNDKDLMVLPLFNRRVSPLFGQVEFDDEACCTFCRETYCFIFLKLTGYIRMQ